MPNVLAGRPEGERPLRIVRRRWIIILKWTIKKGWEGMN
jgi:hypothetical protein